MRLILILILTFITTSFLSQNNNTLPSVKLTTLSGKPVDISSIQNNGNPIVISFWATYCKPCKDELNKIAEVYDKWQNETNVKLIAVSIDDERSIGRVNKYLDSQKWDYTVLLDLKGDLKRAMNVITVPHTFLIDGNGTIVWQHKNYSEGDVEELYEEIKSLNK